MEKLSNGCVLAFQLATVEAQHLGCGDIDIEHIFLGLCKVNEFCELTADNVMFEQMNREDLQDELDVLNSTMKRSAFSPVKARRRLRYLMVKEWKHKAHFSGHRSERCRHTFRVAREIAEDFGWHEIRAHHLMDAVLLQESSILDELLGEMRVKRQDLMILKNRSNEEPPKDVLDQDTIDDLLTALKPTSTDAPRPETPFLDDNARDITQLARQGKLKPVIGRHQEIKQIARVLVQSNKNNVLLVGEPGVGKTCLLEGLSQLVISPDAPVLLRKLRIVEISLGELVAGTKYRGEFEEKLTTVLNEAKSDPNLVLFIDEMHTLISAGAAEGCLSAANLMKPALARGEIKCIGATTTDEYRRYLEKDQALQRRFQVIWVDEPSPEESVAILKGLRPHFQRHFGIQVPDEVLQRAVELVVRYLPDLRLPDKAIDLIDQACSAAMIGTISPGMWPKIDKLDHQIMAQVLSERCRIPLEDLTEEESTKLLRMEAYLEQRVKGQDQAVHLIAEAVRAARVGLKHPNRPGGVFFLAGPSGTGKTELARSLAACLFGDEKRLLRFDMSEYGEKHSIARMIGAPPGYVGHGDGQLTGAIRNNPYTVILFDEIEKAHPDVFDIFLQILDAGRLTDGRGRQVSFSESIIIFTSNLGASSLQGIGPVRQEIGFMALNHHDNIGTTCDPGYESQVLGAVRAYFRPEFINRLGQIVVFKPLDMDTVAKILDKIVSEANQRMAQKGIRLVLDEKARDFLIARGYSIAFGARELERCFIRFVNEPLARMILNKEIEPPEVVELSSDGEKIIIMPGYGVAI